MNIKFIDHLKNKYINLMVKLKDYKINNKPNKEYLKDRQEMRKIVILLDKLAPRI